MTAQRVLVVDDDPTVSEVLSRYLLREGYDVQVVADGKEALDAALADPPDAVLLDLMLPGMHGLEVFRRLRESSEVPVLMLSALSDEDDRLAGLGLGADDYVTKPFSPQEVVLRLRSVLRRSTAPELPTVLGDGPLRVDTAARQAWKQDHRLALTTREYDLLVFFLQHPGVAYSREDLLRQVWGWEYADSSTVTVHVRRLREKVEDEPRAPRRVVTVFGHGYRYELTA